MEKKKTTKKTSAVQQMKDIKSTLRGQFQLKNLRPGQEEVIAAIMKGENALAIMPTGAGKSLCYQLPALHLEGTTIVVSPLISLMKDQKEKVEDVGIVADELNSAITKAEADTVIDNMENSETEIIYVTPERFSNPEFIKSMESIKIDFVVIDEAHCVSQWGHDFRPAYLTIGETLKKLKSPPVLGLTATATDEVADDIKKQLGLSQLHVFRSSVFRDNLNFEALYLEKPDEKLNALLEITRDLKDSSGIIYTATVKAATEIQEFLNTNGVPALIYHGKLKKSEREANQDEFMRNSPRLMVATNAFGMGIDKPDVRFVLHYQFPASLEAYYQEAGRAGRDAQPARCILLYLRRDKSTQSLFLSGKYPTEEDVLNVYLALQKKQLKKEILSKENIVEMFTGSISKTKVSVIFSLLKQTKVLRETKKNGLELVRDHLDADSIVELANTYKVRAERDQKKLSQVIIYAQSALCRWKNILQYFGEKLVETSCGHCDNCLSPSRQVLSQQL